MMTPSPCSSRANWLFSVLYGCALGLAVAQPQLAHSQTLTGLAISPSQPTVAIGSEIQLSAHAAYSDGSSKNVTDVATWSSADPRAVSVSKSGVALGLAAGIEVATARYQGKTATAAITISLGDIEWSGPITIYKGGTYSGKWRSRVPSVAAVTIATSAPVLIENSYVTGPGDLINDSAYGNNLTVRNVIGLGVNPNARGLTYGLFVDAQNPALLHVENCYFENVLYGIWVRGYAGNRDGTQTIKILNNRGRNTLGVLSDGNGGYLPAETNWQFAHTILLGNMPSVPGVEIAWNELVNYPYKSLVNEVVDLYDAGGTAASPTVIHDNYVQGAYAYNPAVDVYNGGGITTDGTGEDTVETAPAFIHIYNNQVVATVNVGIAIENGHDNAAYYNKVISSGLLPNGTRIPSQNVGLSIFDDYGTNIQNGSMYNNNMDNNNVGWMCWATRCAWDGYRSDDYFPDNNNDYYTNQTISANPITLQSENQEYINWTEKLTSERITVGPTVHTIATDPGGPANGSGPTVSTTAWYTIINTNSSLCAEAVAGASDGTRVKQYTCGVRQANQEWQFQKASDGYYKVVNRGAFNRTGLSFAWDVSGGPWATGVAKVQLWTYAGDTNQEWMPLYLGHGAWKFVVRSSRLCLDVPGATSEPLAVFQQYYCNGSNAQSYFLKEN